MYLSFYWPASSERAARFSRWVSHFVSNRPIWPAEAAEPGDRPVAHEPTHRRIAVHPFGIIHILVADQPPEHQLSQQARQPMAPVVAVA
jgi:hypothetical protein